MMDFVNGVTGTLATIRATPFYWRVHVFGTKALPKCWMKPR